MRSVVEVPGATACTEPLGYLMSDLPCNNVQDCGSTFLALSSDSETEAAARVHGWRVWRGIYMEPGSLPPMDLVLCPACVGYRVRRDPVPERLEGEQPLF